MLRGIAAIQEVDDYVRHFLATELDICSAYARV